jgi:hypothetical protein
VHTVLPKDTFGIAANSALKHWDALTAFTQAEHLEASKAMISYCTSLAGLSWAGNLRVH